MDGLEVRNIYLLALLACATPAAAQLSVAYLYTEAPRYESSASLTGAERFPGGAAIQYVQNGQKRALIPGFAASADPAVSFDGRRVLFAGKQKPSDPWQIWETTLDGKPPRRVVASKEDLITPFYLPIDKLVYAKRTPQGFRLEVTPLAGGPILRLTYAPGNQVVNTVLRDGRVVYEAPHPAGSPTMRDLYAVYVDGSGVETIRCDHGRDRSQARELSSGDLVFVSSAKMARFTSSRAVEMPMPPSKSQLTGPIAEIGPEDLLVSCRSGAAAPWSLCRWHPGSEPVKIQTAATNAIQPVIVREHTVPKRHPSSLGNRDGANLLCLNVYTSKMRIPGESVSSVRVWAKDDSGAQVALGEAPVEPDGSFYVQIPSERPVRLELLDRNRKILAAEQGWFWMRRGEQRVCVGCHAGPERAPENATPQVLLRTTEPLKMQLPVHPRMAEAK